MTHSMPSPTASSSAPYTIPVVFGPARPTRYAYRILTVDRAHEGLLGEGDLNALGREGWLLVSVMPHAVAEATDRVDYIFLRATP
jgi:hypothetical protein